MSDCKPCQIFHISFSLPKDMNEDRNGHEAEEGSLLYSGYGGSGNNVFKDSIKVQGWKRKDSQTAEEATLLIKRNFNVTLWSSRLGGLDYRLTPCTLCYITSWEAINEYLIKFNLILFGQKITILRVYAYISDDKPVNKKDQLKTELRNKK